MIVMLAYCEADGLLLCYGADNASYLYIYIYIYIYMRLNSNLYVGDYWHNTLSMDTHSEKYMDLMGQNGTQIDST